MSIPSLVVRSAPAVTRALGAWVKRAPIKEISKFRAFIEKHPIVSTILADVGVEGVIQVAEDETNPKQKDVLGVLNEYANEHGINDGDASETGFFENVKNDMSNLLTEAKYAVGIDDGPSHPTGRAIVIDAREAEAIAIVRDMAQFVKNEVSASGPYVLRYHTMMRAFLAMSPDSVANMIKVHF